MRNLDETGLVVGGCRHTIAQAAVNMFRGEMYVIMYACIYTCFIWLCLYIRYGYTHYLHMNDFVNKRVRFLWQDVICQYWPWAERTALSSDNALQMKPCLPAMHAKAHTWHCQVRIHMYVLELCQGWFWDFWGSQKPPPSQNFLLIVHKVFQINGWYGYIYHQR